MERRGEREVSNNTTNSIEPQRGVKIVIPTIQKSDFYKIDINKKKWWAGRFWIWRY